MHAANSAHRAGKGTPSNSEAPSRGNGERGFGTRDSQQSQFSSGATARARRRFVALSRKLRCPAAWLDEVDAARRYAEALDGVSGRAARQAQLELTAFIPLAQAGLRAALAAEFPHSNPPATQDAGALSVWIWSRYAERS